MKAQGAQSLSCRKALSKIIRRHEKAYAFSCLRMILDNAFLQLRDCAPCAFILLNVHSCKLYNNKYVNRFKLLSHKVLFTNRKDNRNY